jgi:hypothetical protein
MALSRNGKLDESCLLVFYRIDAAEAEMVHGKFSERAALSIRRRKRRNYSRNRPQTTRKVAGTLRVPSAGSQKLLNTGERLG